MADIVEVFFDVISVHLRAWSNIFGRQKGLQARRARLWLQKA